MDAEVPDPARHLDFAVRQLTDDRVWPWHWPRRADGSGGRPTRAYVRARLEAEAARWAEDRYCLWWWRERSGGELVGYAGLSRDEVEGEPAVEVGWSISPQRQRRGFATEAAITAIAWGFDVCGLQEIVSLTLVSNLASRRVMEKAGMKFAREIDRVGLPHVLYAIRPS